MRIKDTFITFAGSVATKKKVEKDVKVKGYVRKGKFIRSFQRKQDVNDKTELAKKVAVSTAIAGAGILGVSLASYGLIKLRYNKNLLNLGQKMKEGKNTLKMREDIRGYKVPKVVNENKESLTFIFPGLATAENTLEDSAKTGGVIQRALQKTNKAEFKKMEFINTGYSEMISKPVPNPLKTATTDILEFAKKATIKGESQDATAIAQEIFDWHKLNPTKNINFITHSAGGMVARDTSHILVNAGVPAKQIKMLGVASPNYGIVDDIVETKYIMHPDDLFSNVSLDKGNTRWIRSPKNQMNDFVDENEKNFIKSSKINELLAIHSAGAYWGLPGINKTAKSTAETASTLFFNRK